MMMILHLIITVGEAHGPREVLGVVIYVLAGRNRQPLLVPKQCKMVFPLYWEDLSNCLPVR